MYKPIFRLQQINKNMNALLAAITTPAIIVGAILLTTVSCLVIKQNQTKTLLEQLLEKTSVITKEQEHLTSMHETLLRNAKKLETETIEQKNLIKTIDKSFKEKIIIVSGIPEIEEEDLEFLVRKKFQKNFGLSFGEYDIENVQRIGRKTNKKERNIKIRFFYYQDKLKVISHLSGSDVLVIEDDLSESDD